MNNSPSYIFQPLLLLKRYHQSRQAVFAATGINGISMYIGHIREILLMMVVPGHISLSYNS